MCSNYVSEYDLEPILPAGVSMKDHKDDSMRSLGEGPLALVKVMH